MVFSSLLFLFLFLPGTLLLYFSAGLRIRNLILLVASLFFYTWGEAGYVFLMVFSICANWLTGLLLCRYQSSGRRKKLILTLGIVLNLLPLAYFKYGGFILENVGMLSDFLHLAPVPGTEIHLPIGISFFTFQALSYLVDIYRNDATPQKNPINLALYISLFPQLIAGPIVRYHDIAVELVNRKVTVNDFQAGIHRFTIGLAKKILIANTLGAFPDHIYNLPIETIPAPLLWLSMLCYTLQIYYDFSAYSDMAIGLGRMFGFHFLENFNYPYLSRSIQEFWRRWHISLSSWFRDYLYIPLGGNRFGIGRTYVNLLIVFFLCGLWHGASWTFVIWGLYHGFFLILERGPFGKMLSTLPVIIRFIYTFFVVNIGWVFFRASSLDQAILYIKSLTHFDRPLYLDAEIFATLNTEFYCALVIGLLFMFPLYPAMRERFISLTTKSSPATQIVLQSCSTIISSAALVLIFIYGTALLLSGSHNPFLYFRF